MEKSDLAQRYQSEKAIIDALLKISEIVRKTEVNRTHQNSNKRSKKTFGDGDYNDLCDDDEQQEVPVPPPMRTLDSYISGFNQRSSQTPSNCNQASTHRWRQFPSNRPLTSSEGQHLVSNNCEVQKHSHKRRCSASSSIASSFKKSSRHYSSCRANKNTQPTPSETEKTGNPPAIVTSPSQAGTILDAQSSSSIIMPVTSAPTIPPLGTIEKQPCASSADLLTNSKRDFDTFTDQELQVTLEKYVKTHLLSSAKATSENIQQQRKTRLSSLTKCETGKLINEFNFPKQTFNLDYYEKQVKSSIKTAAIAFKSSLSIFQRELAILAAKQGNYSLSYSIYTNLLHDHAYDYKLKSDILASRATTLLFEQKCFESIDDCTQALAFNQWNKLAYVVRAACWMIKQEYFKAVEDYSKLFHFFDQSQYVLDLLNLAYEKLKLSKTKLADQQSIPIEHEKENQNMTPSSVDHQIHSLSLASPTASFIQPAVYLCYPYQAYPAWSSTNNEGIQ